MVTPQAHEASAVVAPDDSVHIPDLPSILLESTRLPEAFHPDPADRIIVATARSYGATLLTQDRKILDYPHVRTAGPT
jgi:PIN domain nuclease of toxin-antitoxin system